MKKFTEQELKLAFCEIQRRRSAKGVAARMKWSKKQRSEQARAAARARWAKPDQAMPRTSGDWRSKWRSRFKEVEADLPPISYGGRKPIE
jgi:hypothetical protein